MHIFLVCACKSQDFVQSQKKCVWSHDLVTVTFRNSGRDVFLRLAAKYLHINIFDQNLKKV